mmetsp:Transcript_22970/g.58514  ORF Transcript_22970/g.58514 Transcript_22970/m.58514 type:complete len:281 (-) Transcript_22970:26-868(-)
MWSRPASSMERRQRRGALGPVGTLVLQLPSFALCLLHPSAVRLHPTVRCHRCPRCCCRRRLLQAASDVLGAVGCRQLPFLGFRHPNPQRLELLLQPPKPLVVLLLLLLLQKLLQLMPQLLLPRRIAPLTLPRALANFERTASCNSAAVAATSSASAIRSIGNRCISCLSAAWATHDDFRGRACMFRRLLLGRLQLGIRHIIPTCWGRICLGLHAFLRWLCGAPHKVWACSEHTPTRVLLHLAVFLVPINECVLHLPSGKLLESRRHGCKPKMSVAPQHTR